MWPKQKTARTTEINKSKIEGYDCRNKNVVSPWWQVGIAGGLNPPVNFSTLPVQLSSKFLWVSITPSVGLKPTLYDILSLSYTPTNFIKHF